ncbi:MAG: hypothetical protein K8R91_01410 [Phycisphaerae bacterium]|nr:hypothetical protein [Phycisphaerae bacterium]
MNDISISKVATRPGINRNAFHKLTHYARLHLNQRRQDENPEAEDILAGFEDLHESDLLLHLKEVLK